jgi:hypothetical protein
MSEGCKFQATYQYELVISKFRCTTTDYPQELGQLQTVEPSPDGMARPQISDTEDGLQS